MPASWRLLAWALGVAARATTDSFDCEAGFKHRRSGWSMEKKRWCCKHKDVGCAFVTDADGNKTSGFCCLAAPDRDDVCGSCHDFATMNADTACGSSRHACLTNCGDHAVWCDSQRAEAEPEASAPAPAEAESDFCCMAGMTEGDTCGSCFAAAIAEAGSRCGGSREACESCGGSAAWCRRTASGNVSAPKVFLKASAGGATGKRWTRGPAKNVRRGSERRYKGEYEVHQHQDVAGCEALCGSRPWCKGFSLKEGGPWRDEEDFQPGSCLLVDRLQAVPTRIADLGSFCLSGAPGCPSRGMPTPAPTPPTPAPTTAPSPAPTRAPTAAPSPAPTAAPSAVPTAALSAAPTASAPTPAATPPKVAATAKGPYCCLAGIGHGKDFCARCFPTARTGSGTRCGASREACLACGGFATWCDGNETLSAEEARFLHMGQDHPAGTTPRLTATSANTDEDIPTSSAAESEHRSDDEDAGYCCLAAERSGDFCSSCYPGGRAEADGHCGSSRSSCVSCGGRATWCTSRGKTTEKSNTSAARQGENRSGSDVHPAKLALRLQDGTEKALLLNGDGNVTFKLHNRTFQGQVVFDKPGEASGDRMALQQKSLTAGRWRFAAVPGSAATTSLLAAGLALLCGSLLFLPTMAALRCRRARGSRPHLRLPSRSPPRERSLHRQEATEIAQER